MNKRRELLIALGASVLARASSASGQQPMKKAARIGYIFASTPTATAHNLEAFRQGLQALGYVEGRNIILQVRYAESRAERLPGIARELIGLKVDIIVAVTDGVIAAVKRETQVTPIVMVLSSDPVGTGFVASLARPGSNVTGLSTVSPELSGKRLELLREVFPGLSRVAFLWNPDVRGAMFDYKETEGAARSLGLQLQSVEVLRAEDFDRAFAAVSKGHAQAFVLPSGIPAAYANRQQIVSFAQKNRLPSVYGQKEYVEAGGLMSYGPSTPDLHRRAAIYVKKILKGAKPADLPVEQPRKFDLVINLKTAKALGLTIPPSLLARADQVIE